MLQKIINKLGIISIFIAILLVVFCSIIDFIKKPKNDLYFSGIINGSINEIYNTKYKYKTFDKNMKEIRSNEIDIFLMHKFYISFNEEERFVTIYTSEKKINSKEENILYYSILNPDGIIDLQHLNKKTIYFSFNVFPVDINTDK